MEVHVQLLHPREELRLGVQGSRRLQSIDFLRGLVMVLMPDVSFGNHQRLLPDTPGNTSLRVSVFIADGGAVWLPMQVLTAAALLTIAGHGLLASIQGVRPVWLWNILYGRGNIEFAPGSRAPKAVPDLRGRCGICLFAVVHMPVMHPIAVAISYAKLGNAYWFFRSASRAEFPSMRPPGWATDWAPFTRSGSQLWRSCIRSAGGMRVSGGETAVNG